ncbi:hypothetical protein AC1031_005091 [Aphanomyces cochlioides]|nr:hypothetical protein AC1031_005091 [Aphanomyces cochlioides]
MFWHVSTRALSRQVNFLIKSADAHFTFHRIGLMSKPEDDQVELAMPVAVSFVASEVPRLNDTNGILLGQWSSGFCSCFSSIFPNCCLAFWCPCISLGQTMARVGSSGMTYIVLYGVLYLFSAGVQPRQSRYGLCGSACQVMMPSIPAVRGVHTFSHVLSCLRQSCSWLLEAPCALDSRFLAMGLEIACALAAAPAVSLLKWRRMLKRTRLANAISISRTHYRPTKLSTLALINLMQTYCVSFLT